MKIIMMMVSMIANTSQGAGALPCLLYHNTGLIIINTSLMIHNTGLIIHNTGLKIHIKYII